MFYVESLLAIINKQCIYAKGEASSCFIHDRPPDIHILILKKVVGVNNKPNDTYN